MKTTKNLLLIVIITLVFTGCQEKITDTYMVNMPVYMDRQSFKKSVKVTDKQDIAEPGKIYFKDNYVFINEALKGIHIINNINPADPVFVSFISIPGNMDMAIKDSILFADSFTDLVALDISDIMNIRETGRVDSIFPYSLPPLTEQNQFPFGMVDATKGIVVGWETKMVEEVIETGQSTFPVMERWNLMSENTTFTKFNDSGSGSPSMSVGVGGSLARFTIHSSFLYTVDQYNLRTFDIDDLTRPLLISDLGIGWDVETVFLYQNKLFFGTQTGMLIYDISIPSSPKYISSYSHFKSCDPVVVEGNFAYVTLRAGTLCGEATSQLDVINVSNITEPKWEKSYPMHEPYGLGIDNKTLFICDGEAGLKVYDATQPKSLLEIAGFPDVNAYDVIPFNGVLMMIGKDGLYQYDYSGPASMNLLSYIPIQKKD